jgi:hypothetical protein
MPAKDGDVVPRRNRPRSWTKISAPFRILHGNDAAQAIAQPIEADDEIDGLVRQALHRRRLDCGGNAATAAGEQRAQGRNLRRAQRIDDEEMRPKVGSCAQQHGKLLIRRHDQFDLRRRRPIIGAIARQGDDPCVRKRTGKRGQQRRLAGTRCGWGNGRLALVFPASAGMVARRSRPVLIQIRGPP